MTPQTTRERFIGEALELMREDLAKGADLLEPGSIERFVVEQRLEMVGKLAANPSKPLTLEEKELLKTGLNKLWSRVEKNAELFEAGSYERATLEKLGQDIALAKQSL